MSVTFTISKTIKNGLYIVSIVTKNRLYLHYNVRNCSTLRVFEKMEYISTELNKQNIRVFFCFK